MTTTPITPRNILRKDIGYGYTVDNKDLEEEFANFLALYISVKIETARQYIVRQLQPTVSIALQTFIFLKTGETLLIKDLEEYKFLLVFTQKTQSIELKHLHREESTNLIIN